jgi:predicted metal-binding membrane protein
MAMDTMSTGPDLAGAAGFIGVWVVMMAAMMLPAAAPARAALSRGRGRWARGKHGPTRRRLPARMGGFRRLGLRSATSACR